MYKLISKYFLCASLFIFIWISDAKAQNTVNIVSGSNICVQTRLTLYSLCQWHFPMVAFTRRAPIIMIEFRRKAHWNNSLLIIRPSYLVFETLHDRISKAVCTKIKMSKSSNTTRSKLNEWKLKWDWKINAGKTYIKQNKFKFITVCTESCFHP